VSPAAEAPGGVVVYWRPGCPYCMMLRLGLASALVSATWVNIWEDRAAAARVRAITGGDETVPTAVVGTRAMVNPAAREVIAAVRDELPGTRSTAGTRRRWSARLAGFLSRRPRRGAPADAGGLGWPNGTGQRGGRSSGPAPARTPEQ
jgi:mycoredoxin